MKFLGTPLSFLALAAFSGRTFGDSNLRKLDNEINDANDDKRSLTQGLNIPTESRIVGGKDAEDGAYPFFVSWNGCGASLVADNVILSAAHCKDQSTRSVIVGQSRKGSNANGERREIIKRIPHPRYRSRDINYDYLVMVLDEPVNTELYPPIGLNSQRSIPDNQEELTVIGFGALTQGGFSTPDQLQEVDVNYIPSRTCNRGWQSYNGDVKDATMFCAGTNGGKDSCQGDSGGPIFTKGGQQVGIVSWGRGCAQRRYPGVYSRISGEYGWLRSQICENANTKPAFCFEDYTPEPEPENPSDDDEPIDDDGPGNFLDFVAAALCGIFSGLPFCDNLTF